MLSPSSARALGGLLLLGLLTLAVGCGPDYKARGSVKGTVTFAGKKLNYGNVVFYGNHNMTGSATIRTDGTYSLQDAPQGECKVTVTVPKLPPGGVRSAKDAPARPQGPTMPDKSKEPSMDVIPSRVVPIPEKYSKPETSGLTYTVKSGEQTFDITLTP